MNRRSRVLLLATVLAAASVGALPAATAQPTDRGKSGLEVYVGEVTPPQLEKLKAAGFDHEDLATGDSREGRVPLEVAMTTRQADKLRAEGVDLAVKTVRGKKASEVLAAEARAGYEAYRSYSEPGGIRDELVATAAAAPRIAQLVSIGTSLDGQEIYAVRVTKNARVVPAGQKPAVLYNGAQHAREWITPEMVRRLMHHVLDGYGTDSRITQLVDTRELWFLPVANPDGYDFTFTEGNRLWRKNLRDNNGDGQLTGIDGVDPNRNFPTRWGWDNEGSSPEPSSQTYRGTGPASEPETQAMDAFVRDVGFTFQVNYHSAAELLLYGTGWQSNTPTPDDVIYEALVGDDANPAVPGYDPDLSAELYVTNGDTTDHMHNAHGTLAITPEMSTCQSVSAADPNDEWEPRDCASVFNFPDDEELIEQEFRKNIPLALSFAESAATPDSPVSSVGRTAAPMVADAFAVSHGTRQPVAVVAKRALNNKRLHYSINGGREVTTTVAEWGGGERYGSDNQVYYAEYRGVVTGAGPGDSVSVWFSGVDPMKKRVSTAPFTYTVARDIGGDVLVLAAEDVTGASPLQGVPSAKYAAEFERAINAAGHTSDVYDVDANGRVAPHHLGVLSHYKAVVWETGDDIIPRNIGQPGGTTARLALDLELTARDYVNEGGKLIVSGQYALHPQAIDGVYYYNPFRDQPECTTYGQYPCIPLGNDFLQYWLGAYQYIDGGGFDANHDPLDVFGRGGAFDGFSGQLNGGDSADNQGHNAAFLTTSSFLPPEEFPQFASSAPIKWNRGDGPAPYDPYTGDWYLFSQSDDDSYKRITRTVDLTGATAADLTFQASYSLEANWDYMFVEARPVGTDDWTTLPDANGHTGRGTGDSCTYGWQNELHPQLQHYVDADGACGPTGTTGEWHATTGSSNGWQQWSVDLSRYAGQQVEVSIAYASDWGTQDIGAFLDDLAVVTDVGTVGETSFETEDLAGWAVTGSPEGSAPNDNDWIRSQTAFEEGAGVTTEDTVFLGFGAEGLRTQAQRDDLIRRALTHLIG
jgi:hypothetical protein